MTDRYDLGRGMMANEDQKLAIDKMVSFLSSPAREFTLIGKAGTGKTTIIKKIIEHYNRNSGSMFDSQVVSATISHAAKNVLKKALGSTFTSTVTVAKLLGMRMNIDDNGEIEFIADPKTWKVAPPPIKNSSLIIVDECSMISKSLLSLIREHRLPNCKTLFMGDWHQLPPIDKHREQDEDSETFKIEHQAVLKKRMRQKEGNPVIELSDVFADNIDRYLETGDFEQYPLKKKHRIDNYNPITNEGVLFPFNLKTTFEDIIKDFNVAREENNPNHVKLIAFRNRNLYGKAPYNIASLNATVRKRLWNSKDQYVVGEIIVANEPYICGRDLLFQNGDSMIVEKISHDVIDGIECCILNLRTDMGNVIYNVPVVSREGKPKYLQKLKALAAAARKEHSKWKKFYAFKETFANISYGYAITSHKAQGSGYNNTYIFEDDIMGVQTTTFKEKQQCMYTAITRSVEKCTIFSEKNA